MYIKLTKKDLVSGLFTLYILILILCLSGILTSMFIEGRVNFFYPDNIALISLGLFIPIIFASLISTKNYFLFFFIVILSFPSAINDFLPGVEISAISDNTTVYFPFFTHVEFYLFLGVLVGIIKKKYNHQFRLNIKILTILAMLGCGVVLTLLLNTSNMWDYNLFISHSYHFRYFILILLIFSLYKVEDFESQLINGLFIAIVLIFFESLIFTGIKGTENLISGNYGKNSFANLFAGFLLFLFELRRRKKISGLYFFILVIISISAIVYSGTRGAIVSLLIGIILIYLFSNRSKIVINVMKGLGICVLLILSYQILLAHDKIPKRYSYNEITEKITYKGLGKNFSKTIQIEPSWETNSIISRLRLYDSSINMITDRPFLGIGAGRWNRYKLQYNNAIEEKVLLDSHNDYLSILSQYGLPIGIILIIVIFIYPFTVYEKLNRINNSKLIHLGAINILMAISALSNSGFFKYQISALLIFNFILLFYLKSRSILGYNKISAS